MKTAGGIIIWTLILFALVASQKTVLQGKEGAVCDVNVTKTETRRVWNCEECEEHQSIWYTWKCGSEDCAKKHKQFYVSWTEQKCCDGYQNRNSICEPHCFPECDDGRYCAKPNKCDCIEPGWDGGNCTESLWCVVKVNSTEILSERITKRLMYARFHCITCSRGSSSNNLAQVPYDDTTTEKKRPECLPQCRDQIPNSSVKVTKLKDLNIYFVPIESPCNIEVDRTFMDIIERYKYPLAGTLGIISCAIVALCVTCIFKRKRKATCDGEDIPMRTGATQDYMMENTIYS